MSTLTPTTNHLAPGYSTTSLSKNQKKKCKGNKEVAISDVSKRHLPQKKAKEVDLDKALDILGKNYYELTKDKEGERIFLCYIMETFKVFFLKEVLNPISYESTEKDFNEFNDISLNATFRSKVHIDEISLYQKQVEEVKQKYVQEKLLDQKDIIKINAIVEIVKYQDFYYECKHITGLIEETIARSARITEKLSKDIDNHLDRLASNERLLLDKFALVQKQINSICYNPVANLPDGTGRISPLTIAVEDLPSTEKLASIIAESVYKNKKGVSPHLAIASIVKHYEKADNQEKILQKISSVIKNVVLKKPNDQTSIYTSLNFSSLFSQVSTLEWETNSLLQRLRNYFREVKGNQSELEFDAEETPKSREETENILKFYKDFFKEADSLMANIFKKKAELLELKEKIKKENYEVTKLLNQRLEIISGNYTILSKTVQYTIDEVKSNGITYTTMVGSVLAPLGCSYGRVRDPNNPAPDGFPFAPHYYVDPFFQGYLSKPKNQNT